MKKYLANTPLIVQGENGEDVRVERGETVTLSDAQYAEVAAHVTPIDVDEQTEHLQESQTETPAETADKPKRGGKTKESTE